MMAIALFCAACAAQLREGVRVAKDGVYFQLRRPAAISVSIAGDFNNWSQDAHPMRRSGDFWTSVVPLPPGDYAFMYLVNGMEWVTPPNAMELVPDVYGSMNGKVSVP